MNRHFSIQIFLAATACQAQSELSALEALKLASQNRPSLSAARLRVEEAKASARSLRSSQPIELLIGASTRKEVGATDQDLAISQGIDLFGRQRPARFLGEAGVQRALAHYLAEASALQAEVLTAFAEAASSKLRNEVTLELLKVSKGLFDVTKRRFDEGRVAEVQVARAAIELERSKQSAELRQADFKAAIKRLSGLIGVDAEKLSVRSDGAIESLVSPNIDHRPEILELKADASVADSEANVASASTRPEFSLQIIRSPWGDDQGHFAGRAQIRWAIFDYGKAKNESRAARLRAESARKQLEDAISKAQIELEVTNIEIMARQARVRSYEAILASAREMVEKSQKGFSEGIGTQIDVLEATRALREVEQELVEARQQLSFAVINQYRVSGFLVEVLK